MKFKRVKLISKTKINPSTLLEMVEQNTRAKYMLEKVTSKTFAHRSIADDAG
jgi:hypothetical protein